MGGDVPPGPVVSRLDPLRFTPRAQDSRRRRRCLPCPGAAANRRQRRVADGCRRSRNRHRRGRWARHHRRPGQRSPGRRGTPRRRVGDPTRDRRGAGRAGRPGGHVRARAECERRGHVHLHRDRRHDLHRSGHGDGDDHPRERPACGPRRPVARVRLQQLRRSLPGRGGHRQRVGWLVPLLWHMWSPGERHRRRRRDADHRDFSASRRTARRW